jgi:hypothetical protein
MFSLSFLSTLYHLCIGWWLTSWTNVLVKKKRVADHAKKFLDIYEILSFPPLDSILSQYDLVHILTRYFKILFNIIFPPTPRPPKLWASFLWGFQQKFSINFTYTLCLLLSFHLTLIHPNNIWWRLQLMKLLPTDISPHMLFYILSVRSRYFPWHFVLSFNIRSFLTAANYISDPHKIIYCHVYEFRITGFIDHLHVVTTNSYNTVADFHTLRSVQHTLNLLQPAVFSLEVSRQRLLTMAIPLLPCSLWRVAPF